MNILAAFLKKRCPRCHQGKIYPYGPYNFSHFQAINHKCGECGIEYEKEPGFFYGGLYFSYAINVGLIIVGGFSTIYIMDDPDIYIVIGVASALVLLFFPLTLQFSKVLMLYFFGGIAHDPELEQDIINQKRKEKTE